jgi:hypothetical protein
LKGEFPSGEANADPLALEIRIDEGSPWQHVLPGGKDDRDGGRTHRNLEA